MISGAVAALLIAVFILAISIFQVVAVSGKCMEPVLLSEKQYLVNKWAYLFAEPAHNDIIVYEMDDTLYVARVVGLPLQEISADRQLDTDEYYVSVDNPATDEEPQRFIKQKDIVGKIIRTE